MEVDVPGRVSNIKLGHRRCLQPLFEAIMNSVHSIEETKRKDGEIKVSINRDTLQQTLVELEARNFPVSGFTVRDNGVGFTDQNFHAFDTSDTTVKVARGGKGVGRFLWLKAFDRAEVTSVFRSNGSFKQREFAFSLKTNGGIDPPQSRIVTTPETCEATEVRLCGFRSDFQRHCPKSAATVALRIIEHFLELFALKACPKIMLIDDVEKTRLDLNRLFSSEMRLESKTQHFAIRGLKFRLNHVRLAAAHAQQHSLNFCAHGRTVRSESLGKLAPYLDPVIPDQSSGQHFIYAGYISGDYLNENVMSERTQFDISEEPGDLTFPDEVSWPEGCNSPSAGSRCLAYKDLGRC